jgi:diguanylate cyclase (GGDEF)-like protein
MQVPHDLRGRLSLDQAEDFTKVILARAIIGLNTVALLFFDYMRQPLPGQRNFIMLCIESGYISVIVSCVLWSRRHAPSPSEAKAHINRISLLLVVLGVLWGLLFNALVPFGNLAQHELLYGVAIGLMATPVLVSPKSAAFAFWVPICLGAVAGQLSNPQHDSFALTDLLAFIALTGYCIVYLNKRMNERAIGAIRLEENAEVIKLLLRDFEESASDWLWETNEALELRRVSPRMAQVMRRPAEQISGVFPAALLGHGAMAESPAAVALSRLNRAIAERSAFRDLTVPVIIEGEEHFWSLTGKPILDKFGRFAGYHGVGSDITGQRRQQEQIAFLARHDSLTKLPNRVLFSETLHEACDHCETSGVALLCLDLDHFKVINDTLGHATGDAVLVAVSERLRGCIREFDIGARLGGDEFAVIVFTDDAEEAISIARRIIERISRPFHFDGQLVQIGISIGIALAPQDAKTPGALMKNGDLALYRAKAEGRGVLRLYDPEMDERLQARRALQSALRRAVARGELYLEYQPIVDLATRRITGAEALVRWRHPERGLLSPGEFVPLAEESGLISEIGAWVLQQACSAAADWPPEITVAVNLSPLQFRNADLVSIINKVIIASGLPPERLELEIVESTMLDNNTQTAEALWQLNERGMRIALDDFGTGYSSLSYLRRFPFDKIKIDRSFIRDLGYEKDDSSIILAIIGLAERMNMVVTAEGVEHEEQAELLISYGCAQAQGYLFYRPLSAAAFAEALAQEAKTAA